MDAAAAQAVAILGLGQGAAHITVPTVVLVKR